MCQHCENSPSSKLLNSSFSESAHDSFCQYAAHLHRQALCSNGINIFHKPAGGSCSADVTAPATTPKANAPPAGSAVSGTAGTATATRHHLRSIYPWQSPKQMPLNSRPASAVQSWRQPQQRRKHHLQRNLCGWFELSVS